MPISSARAAPPTSSCAPWSSFGGAATSSSSRPRCRRSPSSASAIPRSRYENWRSNVARGQQKLPCTDGSASFSASRTPNFFSRGSSAEPHAVYSKYGGSVLVRRRIQTPSDATVLSVVQPEGEVVLGGSPPARRLLARARKRRAGGGSTARPANRRASLVGSGVSAAPGG